MKKVVKCSWQDRCSLEVAGCKKTEALSIGTSPIHSDGWNRFDQLEEMTQINFLKSYTKYSMGLVKPIELSSCIILIKLGY